MPISDGSEESCPSVNNEDEMKPVARASVLTERPFNDNEDDEMQF